MSEFHNASKKRVLKGQSRMEKIRIKHKQLTTMFGEDENMTIEEMFKLFSGFSTTFRDAEIEIKKKEEKEQRQEKVRKEKERRKKERQRKKEEQKRKKEIEAKSKDVIRINNDRSNFGSSDFEDSEAELSFGKNTGRRKSKMLLESLQSSDPEAILERVKAHNTQHTPKKSSGSGNHLDIRRKHKSWKKNKFSEAIQ